MKKITTETKLFSLRKLKDGSHRAIEMVQPIEITSKGAKVASVFIGYFRVIPVETKLGVQVIERQPPQGWGRSDLILILADKDTCPDYDKYMADINKIEFYRSLPKTEIVKFKLVDSEYITDNGIVLTTDLIMQHPHQMHEDGGWIEMVKTRIHPISVAPPLIKQQLLF